MDVFGVQFLAVATRYAVIIVLLLVMSAITILVVAPTEDDIHLGESFLERWERVLLVIIATIIIILLHLRSC